MRKRKCMFTTALQERYTFVKKMLTNCDVRCTICNTKFSVSHGGRETLSNIKIKQHKNAEIATASSRSVTSFFWYNFSNRL
ncbi:hypothetical protein ANN_01223 [Periplaneta americana]|uniref:Uncharacterized protein n=1 Tax=Periplaneta americana TaxID=6978 RepID=A0ABQ8TSZ7_PERAM|nr:hypothetical protein ANN_01223 [Periplaneta americana]